MKRSQINKAIKDMEKFLKKMNVYLPDFAYWSTEDWKDKNNEYDIIRDNKLGWDITDAGLDDFENIGFSLFTCRNGNINKSSSKKYAEKYIMIKQNQEFPFHFHWQKTEDIINRGGGTLLITVYNDDDGNFSKDDVLVESDGREYYVKAGESVELNPGQSITLKPYQYHKFSVKENTGDVLVGEVSEVNDDDNDNRFYEQVGRFPEIIEDEKPYKLLCNEYPKYNG